MPELFTTAVGFVWTQISSCVDTISGNAILLLGVAVPAAGAVIGLSKRLLRFGGRRK